MLGQILPFFNGSPEAARPPKRLLLGWLGSMYVVGDEYVCMGGGGGGMMGIESRS